MSIATVDRLRVAATPRRLTVLLVALNVEAALVVGYFAVTDAAVTTPRHLVYPWLWINVAGAALLALDLPGATRRRRVLAAMAAALYLIAMAWLAGLVGVGAGDVGVAVSWVAPGWGPIVDVGLGPLRVTVVPYMAFGYVALAVLGYAALLDAASAAAPGVVGLASCVGCAWPVAGAVLAAVGGGTAGIGTAVTQWSYGLSTLVFLAAVAVLYWRPGAGRG